MDPAAPPPDGGSRPGNPAGPGPRRAREEPLLALVLVLAYGWLFVFFPRINNPNELSRLYMARALAEHGTYCIGVRTGLPGGGFADAGPVYSEWGYVNDKALVCDDPRGRPPECAGRLYAAKAPGASLAGAPLVALLRPLVRAAAHRDPTRSELIFCLRWALVIAPSILLWLCLRRFLLRAGVEPALARIAVLAGACGSVSLTYGQMFAGHQPGSLALASAFLAAFWPRSPAAGRSPSSPAEGGGTGFSDRRALLIGACAGAAVLIEYPCAPAALLVVAGWIGFRKPGGRAVIAAALGALGPLLVLAHFHTVAFGGPLRTPYGHLENPGFVRDLAPGFLGISLPTWERIQGSLLSPFLGLFYWAPWTALALPAAAAVVRAAAPARAPAISGRKDELSGAALTAAAVVAYEFVFQISHALWRSGWTVGPRYIAPVAPFAAVLIALALRSPRPGAWPASRRFALALFGGAGAAGIAATGLASAVSQGFPLEVYNPLVEVVWPLLSHGYSAPNLLQRLSVPGLWSALPYFAALLAAAFACLFAAATEGSPSAAAGANGAACGSIERAGPGLRWAAVAGAIFALFTLAQWTAVAGDGPGQHGAARFLAESWDPDPPPGSSPLSQQAR